MFEYKSVHELIIKAALYDGISTTISPFKVFDGLNALKITFSDDDRHTSVAYMPEEFKNHESMVLYGCKNALRDLLFAPYEEIVCEERK